jgi:hypothetical protein
MSTAASTARAFAGTPRSCGPLKGGENNNLVLAGDGRLLMGTGSYSRASAAESAQAHGSGAGLLPRASLEPSSELMRRLDRAQTMRATSSHESHPACLSYRQSWPVRPSSAQLARILVRAAPQMAKAPYLRDFRLLRDRDSNSGQRIAQSLCQSQTWLQCRRNARSLIRPSPAESGRISTRLAQDWPEALTPRA